MTKGKIKYIVICLIIVVAVIGAGAILPKLMDIYNGNKCGISLTDKNRVFKAKTPSSFHGDGASYQVYHFEREDINQIVDNIKKNNKWLSCPFDNVTTDIIEGDINHNEEYIELLKGSNYTVPVPSIENGYYLNFTLYVLDIDNALLYIITYDS